MTSIAKLLKETIERTAKKQVRSETEALRKASARYRKNISDLGSRLKEVERELSSIRRQVSLASPGSGEQDARILRFSAKGLNAMRQKLALSKTECGKLIGVSARLIGLWESGQVRPTAEQVRGIAAIRNIGKREIRMRLEEKVRMKK